MCLKKDPQFILAFELVLEKMKSVSQGGTELRKK